MSDYIHVTPEQARQWPSDAQTATHIRIERHSETLVELERVRAELVAVKAERSKLQERNSDLGQKLERAISAKRQWRERAEQAEANRPTETGEARPWGQDHWTVEHVSIEAETVEEAVTTAKAMAEQLQKDRIVPVRVGRVWQQAEGLFTAELMTKVL